MPTIATHTRVVIVRHHRELHRSSNSGRLANLALTNSEIVDHGIEGVPTRMPPLDDAWVLFPAGPPTLERPVLPPRQLIVLDASWSQARKMYRKIDALRGLPTLRLPVVPVPTARLRMSPGDGMVSTIEAIASALRILEGEEPAAALERLFAVAVGRAQSTGRLIG